MMASNLSITEKHHKLLHQHLFPGDGLEAAAVLLCSRIPGDRQRFLVKEVRPVSYVNCVRDADFLKWPGQALEDAIDSAENLELSIFLIHSHPGGLFGFSRHDDYSDSITMPALFNAIEVIHGTAVMTPNGGILARIYIAGINPKILTSVSVIGDNLRWWWNDGEFEEVPMAFSGEGRKLLSRLQCCVVGVSGTGSIVAEQLARLGFGSVQLIDFDRVEPKNLNRIINSTEMDAEQARYKVDVLSDSIKAHRGIGVAIPLQGSIASREAVLLASQADLLFCCVDSLEGRHIADLMSSAFLQPLFDVGVVIPTRMKNKTDRAIADVCGRIDFIKPDGASLGDRSVYTPEGLRAEYIKNSNSKAHDQEMADGYIRSVPDQAPSVISLNMHAASLCVIEFIARAFPFRHEGNENYARTQFSLAGGELEHLAENELVGATSTRPFARGSQEPLLGLPSLGMVRRRGSA